MNLKKRKELREEINKLPVEKDWRNLYNVEKSKKFHFQKSIIKGVEEYLSSYENDEEKKGQLIKMPTGTGKTAIMAIVSNYLCRDKKVLIIVPSEILKEQIANYLNYYHWIRIGFKPEKIKESAYFEPALFYEKREFFENGVENFICTPTTLSLIYYDNKFDLKKLFYEDETQIIDLVFVDEGHREPAKFWSRAVREINRETLLFTATPYRNDRRFFKLRDKIQEVTFHSARNQKAIRNIKIKKIKHHKSNKSNQKNDNRTRIFSNLEDFVDLFLRYIQCIKNNNSKAIIRCDNQQNIKIAIEFFKTKFAKETEINGRKIVVAIHDTFTKEDDDDMKFSSASYVQNNHKNTIFWIHQFKLMEGVDDKDFQFLFFIDVFSNARSLIQQIGRVIRIKDNENEIGYVCVSEDHYRIVYDMWESYKNYESSNNKIIGSEQIVERIIKSFPDYFYYDKKFNKYLKGEFKKNEEKDEIKELIERDLRLPKITNIFKYDRGIDLIKSKEYLKDNLLDNDIFTILCETMEFDNSDVKALILMGWRINPSEYISDRIFFNIGLECFSLFLYENYVFYRGNLNLRSLVENKDIEDISPSQLERLVNYGEVKIKQVALINSDTNTSVIRRRTEGAKNIAITAPHLTDHLHIVSSVVASINKTSRYVGMTRSRLTEARGSFISIEEYIIWIKDIVGILKKGGTKRLPFFKRYASPIEAPEKSKPGHILVDLRDFNELFLDDVFNEAFDESLAEIDWDNTKGEFEISLQNVKYRMRIEYKNKKFKIKPYNEAVKNDINNKYWLENQDERYKYGSSYLSNEVVFRIITEEGFYYTDGYFFNPSIKLWGDERFENLSLFYGIRELEDTLSEIESQETKWIKARNSKRQTWPRNTIFNLIDKFKHKTSFNNFIKNITDENKWLFFLPDYLICDDTKGEIADFILISKSLRKIVVIHAKMAPSKKSLSAVGFEKVSDQVIKNLRIFDPYNLSKDDFVHNWEEKWENKSDGIIINRIRRNIDSKKIDEIVQCLIDLQRGDVEKEVWIFYGKGFSAEDLTTKLKDKNPIYNVKHLAYSILNCNQAVSEAGAKLRIFTSP